MAAVAVDTETVVARRTGWWQRPWVAPLGIVAGAFVAFSLPPYLTLDPAQSRVSPPGELSWYYPMLISHIGFASIAMTSCVTQVWPWFRQRFPVAHRRIGRVYVFAGVLPAGVTALAVASAAPFGPVAATSSLLMGSLWLLFTLNGYRAARARRFGEHRKWMIRSFALTMSIISNRVWAGVLVFSPVWPALVERYDGNEALIGQAVAGMTTWLGWTIPLLAAEWWLQRRRASASRSATIAG